MRRNSYPPVRIRSVDELINVLNKKHYRFQRPDGSYLDDETLLSLIKCNIKNVEWMISQMLIWYS